MNELKILEFIE